MMTRLLCRALVTAALFLVGAVVSASEQESLIVGVESYVVVNESTYTVTRKGDPWWGGAVLEKWKRGTRKPEPWVIEARVQEVAPDVQRNRAFLLLSMRQDFYGYAVVDAGDLHLLARIPFQPPAPGGGLIISPQGDIFVSHGTAEVYDGHSYERARRLLSGTGESLDFRRACLLDGGRRIYAGVSLFDATTGALVRSSPARRLVPPGTLPLDCISPRVLLLEKASDGNAVVWLYDASEDKVLKKIETGEPMPSLVDEWRLWDGGRLVLRDWEEEVRNQARKKGVLEVFDTQEGRRVAEIRVLRAGQVGLGIVGRSPDDGLLFYGVLSPKSAVVVVDMKTFTVRAEIALPFVPVGVIWK